MVRFDQINIETIYVEDGVRQTVEKEPLDELIASIKQHGILQPIVVSQGKEGQYKLQIGSRRMTAARTIGLETVPALILEDPLDPKESLTIMLVENLHREDLDPIDEAEGYARLKDMGTKVSEIARLVGKDRPYVSHSMRLLRLHPKIREALRQHAIPRDQALTLLRLESEQQVVLAGEVMEKGLTTMETRNRVRNLLGKKLKWRLVPIRLEPAIYDKLARIAPDGNVAEFLKKTVENLIYENYPATIDSFA